MIALHMGGIPETAMFLGPILLIIAFIRIARRNEAESTDEDDWDADIGDLGDPGEAADGGGQTDGAADFSAAVTDLAGAAERSRAPR
ncbi:hypothetical protein [Kribbella monticola]|uniref:hypothetical protein n=1 Tax=Kribbella monticola TaxID=2185285 RepID=UPI0013004A93|nr:hypothetical protein [Kribbella monticola]